jgi:hypothetical protein
MMLVAWMKFNVMMLVAMMNNVMKLVARIYINVIRIVRS